MFSVVAVARCWVLTTYYRFHQYVSYVFCGVSVGFFFLFFSFPQAPSAPIGVLSWYVYVVKVQGQTVPTLCDMDNDRGEYVVDLITPISGGSAM